MSPEEIEKNLQEHADALGVSPAKLRAVFARGVKECLSEGYAGLPSIYGMARVQRFSMAMGTGNSRVTKDIDMMPDTRGPGDAQSYEISENAANAWPLVFDAMSRNGTDLDAAFPAESIEQVVYDETSTELAVCGTHGSVQWSCTLNLTSGECTFVTNVD